MYDSSQGLLRFTVDSRRCRSAPSGFPCAAADLSKSCDSHVCECLFWTALKVEVTCQRSQESCVCYAQKGDCHADAVSSVHLLELLSEKHGKRHRIVGGRVPQTKRCPPLKKGNVQAGISAMKMQLQAGEIVSRVHTEHLHIHTHTPTSPVRVFCIPAKTYGKAGAQGQCL